MRSTPYIHKPQPVALAVAIVGFLALTPLSHGQTWNVNANGAWDVGGNWSPANVPNGPGATATLGGVITAARTVTMNSTKRVGFLNINSNHAYTIAGAPGAQLRLMRPGNATSELNINGTASHLITAPVRVFSSFLFDGSGELTISGPITHSGGSGNLTKLGTGTLRLSGANATWAGAINVNNGTLIAASNTALGVTWDTLNVNSGGTLGFQGGITLDYGAMNVTGTGYNSQGALRNISGNNVFDSTINLTGNTLVVTPTGTLSLGSSTTSKQLNLGTNTLTVSGAGDTTIHNRLFGSGDIIKQGSGTLTIAPFSGGNNFTGTTYVNEGTLVLAKGADAQATIANLVIGDGIGTDIARWESSNNLKSWSSVVTVNSSGLMDLNGFDDTALGLNMTGGTITTGGGTLSFTSAATTISTFAHANSSTITGNVHLAAFNTVFNIADGAAAQDFIIDGQLSGASNSGFTKNGAGTMVLTGSGTNNITGNVTVNAGVLTLAKTSGNAIQGSASSILTVNSGGTVLLGNSNQIGDNVRLALAGGTFSTGESVGFSEQLGQMTLSGNSTINLGTGAHQLQFADSSSLNWAWTGNLTIYGWDGVPGQSGTGGQIFFGSNASGLTTNQLQKIQFQLPSGLYGGVLLTTGELVPVPELETLVAGALLLLLVAYRERRRISSLLASLYAPRLSP